MSSYQGTSTTNLIKLRAHKLPCYIPKIKIGNNTIHQYKISDKEILIDLSHNSELLLRLSLSIDSDSIVLSAGFNYQSAIKTLKETIHLTDGDLQKLANGTPAAKIPDEISAHIRSLIQIYKSAGNADTNHPKERVVLEVAANIAAFVWTSDLFDIDDNDAFTWLVSMLLVADIKKAHCFWHADYFRYGTKERYLECFQYYLTGDIWFGDFEQVQALEHHEQEDSVSYRPIINIDIDCTNSGANPYPSAQLRLIRQTQKGLWQEEAQIIPFVYYCPAGSQLKINTPAKSQNWRTFSVDPEYDQMLYFFATNPHCCDLYGNAQMFRILCLMAHKTLTKEYAPKWAGLVCRVFWDAHRAPMIQQSRK